MEDWWLVRDSAGHTGWLLAGRLDVDIPEEVGGYGEGSRFVGAYVIAKVMDSGVERKPQKKSKNGKPVKQEIVEEPTAAPVQTEHPEYVTVLSPNKGGLPYDFDQVRVFTWNVKKHRYETAFRQRNLRGYLPVVVTRKPFESLGEQPFFEFRQAIGDGVATDPQSGATRPAQTELWQYRLEGVQVKKVLPPPPPPPPKPARADAPRRAARARSAAIPRHKRRH